MKPKTWAHPKFTHLQRRLKISPALAAGVLEGLWHLTATFDDEGGRMPHTGEQLASWLGVDIDGDAIITALVDCGWLDTTVDGLVVHDWADHRPKYVDDRIRVRAARSTRQNVRCSREQSRTVAKCSEMSPPSDSPSDSPSDLGSPSEKEENTSPPAGGGSRAKAKVYTDQFEEFWTVYPRKDGKYEAFLAYLEAVKDVGHDALMTAIELYAPYGLMIISRDGKSKCPMGSTWLSTRKRRYKDDPSNWIVTSDSRPAQSAPPDPTPCGPSGRVARF